MDAWALVSTVGVSKSSSPAVIYLFPGLRQLLPKVRNHFDVQAAIGYGCRYVFDFGRIGRNKERRRAMSSEEERPSRPCVTKECLDTPTFVLNIQ